MDKTTHIKQFSARNGNYRCGPGQRSGFLGEREYIQNFRERHFDLTNITSGGEGGSPMLGKKHRPETIAKLRVLNSGEGNHFFGKKHCLETTVKMRDAKLGKKASLETRSKMSLTRSGKNNHQFGKPLSQEHKSKISATLMGNIPWNKGMKNGKRTD